MIPTLDTFAVSNKKVLLRVDMNVPVRNGVILDDTRIRHILPTLHELIQKKASIILMTHFGRPNGQENQDYSLQIIVKYLEKLLGQEIPFLTDFASQATKQVISGLKQGEIVLLENLRFDPREEGNDPDFANILCQLGEVYINDAFSVAHRKHASIDTIARLMPSAVGRGFEAEVKALNSALTTPKRPVAAVVGGAKISTKITLLENLLQKVDLLVIGGGMANTFLAARGVSIGKSLCEYDLLEKAKSILQYAKDHGKQILLPVDVVVAKKLEEETEYRNASLEDIQEDEMILDAGDQTIYLLRQTLASMKTILWNGPLGAFEVMPFDKATVEVARFVAMLTEKGIVTSVAGGGDTVSALNHAGVSEKFTYLSTAGGAFLKWLEGEKLAAIEALETQGEILLSE